MFNKGILALGRQIGYDNVIQIQNLRRFAKKETGQCSARLILDSEPYTDSLIRSAGGAENFYRIMELNKKYSRKSMSDMAKNIIDLVLTKFSKKSGTLTISTTTKIGDSIIEGTKFKILHNNAGTRVKGSSYNESDMFFKLDAVFPNSLSLKNGFPEADKQLSYSENYDFGKLEFNYKAKKGMTQLSTRLDAPVDYLDTIADIGSNGNIPTMKGVVDSANNLLNNIF